MRGLVLAAVVLGAASSAHAADMPDFLRGGFSDGLSHSAVNWRGFYAGAQGSWGSANTDVPGGLNSDMQATFVNPPHYGYNWLPLQMTHELRAGYGVFAGYSAQYDEIVLSLEGNFIHDGFNRTTSSTGIGYAADNVTVLTVTNSTATVKHPDFGSLRLRAGYAAGCFLPYGFIGIGIGDETIDRTSNATPPSVIPAWTTDGKNKMIYGYTTGFGVDMVVVGGLFVRAEYEYRRITTTIETNVNTARLGLGYKF
jgi:opacity protein-like surface antigen